MSIPQTIKFVADTTALEASIKSLNKQIGELSEAAKLNFKSREAEDALGRVNKKTKDTKFSVEALGKSFGKMAAIIGGSVVASIAAMNSGLDELSKGFVNILGYQANQYFSKQATIIQSATNGLINYSDALQIAKDIPDFVSDKQIRQIAKLSANLEISNRNGMKATRSMRHLILALNTVKVKEAIEEIDPTIFMGLKPIENKKFNDARKRHEMMIVMQQRLKSSTKETNGVLNSGMSKLLGVINSVSEKFKALGGVIKGVGLIAAGVLGPLGAGVFAAGMLGPIMGPIGIIIGGVISAVFGKHVLELVSEIRKGKNPIERLTNKIGLLIAKITAFIDGLTNTKSNIEVSSGVITSALKDRGLDPNIKSNREKMLKEILGSRKLGFGVGEAGESFLDEFNRAYKTAMKNVNVGPLGKLDKAVIELFNDTREEFIAKYKDREGIVGSLAGKLSKGKEDLSGVAGGIAGVSIGGVLYSIWLILKDTFYLLSTGIIKTVDAIASAGDSLTKSFESLTSPLQWLAGKFGYDIGKPEEGGKEGNIRESQTSGRQPVNMPAGGSQPKPLQTATTQPIDKYFSDISRIADALETAKQNWITR